MTPPSLILLLLLSGMVTVHAYPASADSTTILHHDSIAYQIFLSNPDSAIALSLKSLDEARILSSNYLQGYSAYILSKSYWAKGNYKLSAEYGFIALRLFENSGYSKLWSLSLLSLARTFLDLENNDQAGRFINKAISICKQTGDDYTLAEAYREKSMLLLEIAAYDSALYYTDAGLKLFHKFKDSVSESILFSRKARIYFNQQRYDLSIKYNRIGLRYDSLVGNKRALGIAFYQIANDLVHLQRYDSAVAFLRRSISINKEMHNLRTLVKAHTLLSEIYMERGKPDLAARELQAVSQYKDSLYNVEKSGQVQEMQSLYELASKQQTITLLEKDNQLKQQQMQIQRLFVAVLLTCIVLLSVLIYFLQRYRKLQAQTNRELENKNQSIKQQNEEIQSQAEKLQDLNQLKSKLFSVISHDLRGPIGTLHTLLNMLLHRDLSKQEFEIVSEKLKASLDLTQRTLENLLNWSLSQMEGIKAEPKTIDIRESINEACDLMIEAAQMKGVDIANKIEDEIHVSADSDQLQLILRNLIHNAIKFSKPDQKILVSAFRKSDVCVISVKDHGIGMTNAEIQTVLSAQHHFSKIGTKQEKGTGLGLLLCQEFIKLNGGSLHIQSSPNSGTEVIFSLPLAKHNLN